MEVSQVTSVAEGNSETSLEQRPHVNEHLSAVNTRDPKLPQKNAEENARSSQCIDHRKETRDEITLHQHSSGFSGNL